jgi:prephenate dehydratase
LLTPTPLGKLTLMSEPTMYALGPEGTFCELAAQQVLQRLKLAWPTRYCPTLEATVVAAAEHCDGMATAPIENSRTGTVAAVQDAILSSDVKIVGELNLTVRFNCLANAPLTAVKRIFVQPVAEAQCLEFLAGLSSAEIVTVRSNADALARLEALERDDEPCAAIVPSHSERNGHFQVIRNVQTGESNVTRFLALKSAATAPELDYAMPKTSIVVEPRANRPGLLREILEPFERFGVNVCRLESRPSEDLWSYRFFLDLISPEGQHGAQGVTAALRDLEAKGVGVRVLGNYASLALQ